MRTCHWNPQSVVVLLANSAILPATGCIQETSDVPNVATSVGSLALKNGIRLDDFQIDRRALDATSLDGLSLHDVTFYVLTNGDTLLQSGPLDGLQISSLLDSGHPLDSAQATDASVLLEYIASCALVGNQGMTLYDGTGAPSTICGVDGLDSGWLSRAADLTRAGDMVGAS